MSNIHYIPIGITDFQYDLIEILIAMHYNSLNDEIYQNKLINSITADSDNKTNIDSNNNDSNILKKCLSSRQLIYLLDSHIRAVLNHPCLLVDHFMPRKFLQMETINNLILSSEKFKILQKILFQLVDNFNKDSSNLNVIIISHNVKELDLLEGLLLGQFFKLKRLSGNSLYDEKHLLDFKKFSDNTNNNYNNNNPLDYIDKNDNNSLNTRTKRRKINSNSSKDNLNESNYAIPNSTSSNSIKTRFRKNNNNNNISNNNILNQSNSNSNNNLDTITNNNTFNNDTVFNNSKESSMQLSSSDTSIATNNNSNNNNHSGSNSNNINNNTNSNYSNYTGYSKDDYDYSNKRFKKIWKKNDSLDNRNWLFLTTTNHLIHNENLLNKYNINLIIAFDPLLNADIPAIKNLQNFNSSDQDTNNLKKNAKNSKNSNISRKSDKNNNEIKVKKNPVPIIKLLVKDSPDHYIIEKNLINQIDTNFEYDNIKNSLNHFLQNRFNINSNSNNNKICNQNTNINLNVTTNDDKSITSKTNELNLENLLNNIIFGNDITNKENDHILPLTEIVDDNILDHAISMKKDKKDFLSPRFKSGNLVEISKNTYDWRGYQLDLMQKTIERLNFLKDKFRYNKENSFIKRLAETKRQNELDSLKEDIGKNFKELQDLDKSKIDSDKKFDSMSIENNKLIIKRDKLLSKIKLIEKLINNNDNIENEKEFLDDKIKEYNTSKQDLNEKIKEYLEFHELQTKENDNLRNKYQIDSNEAMNKSLDLNNLKKNKEVLLKEKDGPLPTELNYNSLLANSNQLTLQLKQLKNDSKFLAQYIKKTNENTNTTKTSKTLKSSNSSRFRSTRSVTPNYT